MSIAAQPPDTVTDPRVYDEWAVQSEGILYGPYDEPESALRTQACVGGALVRRTVARLVGSWQPEAVSADAASD